MERRQIGLARLIRRHYLWVPLVPLVFALIFGGIARSMQDQAERLAVHGITAIATVTDREIRTRRDNDGDVQRDHYLSYRFALPAGGTVSYVRIVSAGLYNRVGLGAEIPVLFIPHDPAVHELEPGSNQQGALIFGLFAALFAVVGGVAGTIIWRRKASLLRAARDGEVRQARVTDVFPANVTVNGQPRYRLRWVDAAGHEQTSSPHPLAILPAVGAVVVVYIDHRTGDAWWEGDF